MLRPDLLAALDCWHYVLDPLAHRRSEIPALSQFFVERAAREEGLPVPCLADDARALLWRQSWPGNLRELEQLANRVVLLNARRQLTAEDLAEVITRSGKEVVPRLPSRHPLRPDLEAALQSTQTSGGRTNKKRAALYLGWDPDTLVLRLREAGLGLDVVMGDSETGSA
jgi:DNA-binding NtrC family response regulator